MSILIAVVHRSVLLKEILEIFDPKPGQHFIDCTVGEGGHAEAILERTAPSGRVLGIDRDGAILATARRRLRHFGDRIILVRDTYVNLSEISALYQFGAAHGVLFDLGLSSWQLEESSGGFSFRKDEPLDMRFDREGTDETAAHILEAWSEEDLAHLIESFGEDRFAHRIAHAIAQHRRAERLRTTFELAELIEHAVGRREKIHPATRTFQALRIVVNRELEALERALPQALDALASQGTLIVISYHSLEDRIVKHFMQASRAAGKGTILTSKPIGAGEEEICANPRSRSAKLRAFQTVSKPLEHIQKPSS